MTVRVRPWGLTEDRVSPLTGVLRRGSADRTSPTRPSSYLLWLGRLPPRPPWTCSVSGSPLRSSNRKDLGRCLLPRDGGDGRSRDGVRPGVTGSRDGARDRGPPPPPTPTPRQRFSAPTVRVFLGELVYTRVRAPRLLPRLSREGPLSRQTSSGSIPTLRRVPRRSGTPKGTWSSTYDHTCS